jgi:hypothetical protein
MLSTSIDVSTGAINEFDPDKYFVEMKPVGQATASEATPGETTAGETK